MHFFFPKKALFSVLSLACAGFVHAYDCEVDLTTNTTSGSCTTVNYAGSVYSVSGGDVKFSGSTTTEIIEVTNSSNITLDNASLSTVHNQSPFALRGSGIVAELTLLNANQLLNTAMNAGLLVTGSNTLKISAASTGSLTAKGGSHSAAIGGGNELSNGIIEIYGGTIMLTGGYYGAGMGGGGYGGSGGTIRIWGGDITAQGGAFGSGVGGGYNGNGGVIQIMKGSVHATSGDGAAGIGGGEEGDGGDILITGGTVVATSTNYGAGIGGGYSDPMISTSNGDGGNITITGGHITASGGSGGAGIGGGYNRTVGGGNGGNIVIQAGTVIATGGTNAAGIGGGYNDAGSGGNGADVVITGGSVHATKGAGAPKDIGEGLGGAVSGTLTNGTKKIYLWTTPPTLPASSMVGTAVFAEDLEVVAGTGTASAYGIKDVSTDAAGKVYFYLPAIESIVVNVGSSLTMYPADFQNISISSSPATALKDVSWTNADPTIASLSAAPYVITALSQGSTMLTATSSENPAIIATVAVVVNQRSAGGGGSVVIPFPPPPKNLKVVETGNGFVRLTWDSVSPVNHNKTQGYIITASGNNGRCKVEAPSTSCTISGLTNGLTYFFTAQTVNGAGAGNASNTVSGIPRRTDFYGTPFSAKFSGGGSHCTFVESDVIMAKAGDITFPIDVNFPYGVFRYKLDHCDASEIRMVLSYRQAFQDPTSYWSQRAGGTWLPSDHVKIFDQEVTLILQDGNAEDLDGESNRSISGIGGIVYGATHVPTLSISGLCLLAAGLCLVRQRRKIS